MKSNYILVLSFTTLSIITVVSCKTKKPAAEVKPVTAAVPAAAAAPAPAVIPTYTADIKKILDNACVECHASKAGEGPLLVDPNAFALDVYEKVRAAARGKSFLGTINHEPGFPPMPMDHPKLDDASIGKITAWVQNGMPL